MTRIFVSYRRDDERHFVDRLATSLMETYGDKNVFRDVESLRAGARFADQINTAIAEVDILVVMIGPRWEELAQRDQSVDFVALEIAQAQKTGKVILPVLIDNRPMPAWGSLPPVFAALGELQTFTVRGGRDYEPDVRTLVRQIDGHTGTRATTALRSTLRQRGARTGAAAALVGLIVGGIALASRSNSDSEITADPTATDVTVSIETTGAAPESSEQVVVTDVETTTSTISAETTTSESTSGGGGGGGGGQTVIIVDPGEDPATTVTIPPTTATTVASTTTTTPPVATIPVPTASFSDPIWDVKPAQLSCAQNVDIWCPEALSTEKVYTSGISAVDLLTLDVAASTLEPYCDAAASGWDCKVAYSFAIYPFCGDTQLSPSQFEPDQNLFTMQLRYSIDGGRVVTTQKTFTAAVSEAGTYAWGAANAYWKNPTQRSTKDFPGHLTIATISGVRPSSVVRLNVRVVPLIGGPADLNGDGVSDIANSACDSTNVKLRLWRASKDAQTVYRGFVGYFTSQSLRLS